MRRSGRRFKISAGWPGRAGGRAARLRAGEFHRVLTAGKRADAEEVLRHVAELEVELARDAVERPEMHERRETKDDTSRERHQEGDRRLERPAEHPTAHLSGSGWGMPGRPTIHEAAARTTPG